MKNKPSARHYFMNANKKRNSKPKQRASRGGGGSRGRASSSKDSLPLAQSRPFKTGAASVKTSDAVGQRSCTIRHSELFAQISSKTLFSSMYKYLVNPGQSSMFPWLSVQAAGWERYRFKKLIIEFVSRVAATQSGTVSMGCDYDVADAAPESELALMSYQNAVQDAPWKNQRMVLSPASLNGMNKYRYVRTTDVSPSTAEARQDDAGQLFVAPIGAADGVIWGSLICHYEVEFVTPQLKVGATASNHITIPTSGATLPTGFLGVGAAALGTVSAVQQSLGAPATILQGTRMLLDGLIPGQIYRMTMGVQGTNFVAASSLTPSANITSLAVGYDVEQPSVYNYTRDFIVNDNSRSGYFDWVPGSASATVAPGTGIFSFSNLPNLDAVE